MERQGGRARLEDSSPYHRYMAAKKEEVAKQHPGVSGFDRAKIIGEMWRQLPDSEREAYGGSRLEGTPQKRKREGGLVGFGGGGGGLPRSVEEAIRSIDGGGVGANKKGSAGVSGSGGSSSKGKECKIHCWHNGVCIECGEGISDSEEGSEGGSSGDGRERIDWSKYED